MTLARRLRAGALLLVVSLAPAALAVVPGEINYQGLLLDSGGNAITGPTDLDFALFEVASGGASVWSESHLDVDVLDGVYDVILGSTTPVAASRTRSSRHSIAAEISVASARDRRPDLTQPERSASFRKRSHNSSTVPQFNPRIRWQQADLLRLN